MGENAEISASLSAQVEARVTLTAESSLHIGAEAAARFFPRSVLVAIVQGEDRDKGGELRLFPLRDITAGGLMLKIRNARGDCGVLLREVLNDIVFSPGPRTAVWDPRNGILRVPLLLPAASDSSTVRSGTLS